MRNTILRYLIGFAAILLISQGISVSAKAKLIPSVSTAPAPETPVSVSYTQLIKCFPELRNEAWARKVDLNGLKDQTDRHFPTTHSLLRQREVVLKDPQSAAEKRLRLAAKDTSEIRKAKIGYHLTYHLTLEKLDSKGGGSPIELPAAQKINPSQKDLNGYFANQDIVQDETSYFDTKTKGVTSSYKKNFKDISEIELKDPRRSRRVLCENQKDLGVVCSCFSR